MHNVTFIKKKRVSFQLEKKCKNLYKFGKNNKFV